MRLISVAEYLVLTSVFLLLTIPSFIYLYPGLVGADHSYTVMGASMTPALCPGDLVIVKEVDPASVEVGDIVTVKADAGVFTHRVVEKKQGEGVFLFRTKGDASEDPEPFYMEGSLILGRVLLVIPFRHLYSPYGYMALALAPAALLVAKHIHRLLDATKRRNRRQLRRWMRRSRTALDSASVLLALILVASSSRLMAPHLLAGSLTQFSDEESSPGLFTSGQWSVWATIDIDPDSLNLKSMDHIGVTCYIELHEGRDVHDIDVSTISMNGAVPAELSPTEVGDYDEDGVPDLMVKFDRETVINYLIDKGCGDGDEVELTVTGMLVDGTYFEGNDTIQVIYHEAG